MQLKIQHLTLQWTLFPLRIMELMVKKWLHNPYFYQSVYCLLSIFSENAASMAGGGDPHPTPLAFHQRCGSRAAVIGTDLRTAHRPHAMEDFNNGVVLSNRILMAEEMFEVINFSGLFSLVGVVNCVVVFCAVAIFFNQCKSISNTFFVLQVNLDKLVDKWAGSIEIGVTTNTPSELEFPSTMTNVRSGTWMMTGNGELILVRAVQ